jgi:hypothetical protein
MKYLITGLLIGLAVLFSRCLQSGRPADPRGAAYAGSEACRHCHAGISGNYLHTHHSKPPRSLPATQSPPQKTPLPTGSTSPTPAMFVSKKILVLFSNPITEPAKRQGRSHSISLSAPAKKPRPTGTGKMTNYSSYPSPGMPARRPGRTVPAFPSGVPAMKG